VLEVVLQYPRGQRRGQAGTMSFHCADDFSAADDFGGRETGNFLRKDEIDFQLGVGL